MSNIDDKINRFIEVAGSAWEGVDTTVYMDDVREREPYVRASSGKTPEDIAKLRRKLKRRWAWRAFRKRIAYFIFRLGSPTE